jgi:hypothetical protein
VRPSEKQKVRRHVFPARSTARSAHDTGRSNFPDAEYHAEYSAELRGKARVDR